MRTTIDYGIDLGTTNSEIAVLRGTEVIVIHNKDGSSFTPSTIWIDKRCQLHVGREAYQRFDDPNRAAEFKLLMGQGERGKKTFPNTGRGMLPEELSAEVLKSLKADVRQSTGEELSAAVITVPAAFNVDQCDATRKAAELAGFVTSPLLQEPVAAALAYGFQSTSENVFWMVYDFGGGTFDAAIIQIRDGVIQVVNHEGDNYLGGQSIDWDIVEKKLIPVLTAQYKLPGFRRGGDPDWLSAIRKLKWNAEQAKIEVSRRKEPSVIWIEDLLEIDGRSIDFEYELTPSELQEVVSPYVTRSVNLCRKALQDRNLSGQDIEKILIVGGSSLFPWLQDRLRSEFGIGLELSIDPITVVAQGAAIFAGTQKLDTSGIKAPAGSFRLELEYEPMGFDTDPTVGGKITHPKNSNMEGYTIEFVENKSQWRSGKIPLKANGTFMAEVHAEKGYKCEFLIELCGPSGSRQSITPDRFSYTIGVVITNPPLTHSIGVAMANNEPDVFFEKGAPLPAHKRHIHKTVLPVRKGQKGDLIRIPFIEGENAKRADRNDLLGALEIYSENVKRDVPIGSDVEITIHIDESRMITGKAYVPILDEEFEIVINYEKETENVSELQASFEREKKRLDETREKASETDSLRAQKALARIEQEQLAEEVQSLLEASEGDQGAVPQCQNRLVELKVAIDEVEDAIEWPSLLGGARGQLEFARYYVNKDGDADEKAGLKALEEDMQEIIDAGDPDLLRRHTEKIHSLAMQVALRKPDIWISWLAYCEKRQSSMQNVTQGEQLILQARRAINDNDLEELQAAVRQLISLLPPPEQDELRGKYGGTTII
jgi:molecular chaperone DnaK